MNIESTGVFHSPIGAIQIKANEKYITELKFLNPDPAIKTKSTDSNNPHSIVQKCVDELNEYFNGSRKVFTVPVKPAGTEFEKSVWEELLEIPFGATISYEELSIRLGDVKKIRAIGRANGKNPLPIMIPCHRVVGKDGNLTGYAGGLDRKKWLLIHEGAIGEQMNFFNNN